MLSLILPPILVVVCLVFLVWIFWKKRYLLQAASRRKNIPLRVFVPQEQEKSEGEERLHSEEDHSGLGELAGHAVRTFFSFLTSLLLKPFQRVHTGRMNRKKKWETESEMSVKDKHEEELANKKREYAAAKNTLEQGYAKSRPMISDEITLPQKREEKKEYEQVLIERIAMNPRDVEAYERLGDYYLEGGILDDAKECFKQVLRLSPLSRRARFRMRRVEKILSGRR